jgi:hypothetical protein
MTNASNAAPSRAANATGWALSGILIAFLLLDGAIKLAPIQIVLDTMVELGWSADPVKARILGVLTLGCAVLYAVPKTSIIGAILLTGYLGGAMATHMRIDNPLFSHLLFGLYLGVIAWGGLWLREPRLRALIPLKS